MPTMFVANNTKQNHVFLFFVPSSHDEWEITASGQKRITKFGSGRRMLEIKAGGQIAINNLDAEQVQSIVEQHVRYGMKSVKELEAGERPPLVYSVDKPVNLVHIEEGIKLRDSFLDERSKTIREETAAAAAKQIQDTLGGLGVDVPRVEVSTVEETKSRDERPKVSEGFEILGDGVSSRHIGATPSKRGGNIPF